MGMYTEVTHECPFCKRKDKQSTGHGQVSQVGLGFGAGYPLSSLYSLKVKLDGKEFTADELKCVAINAAEAWFECDNCKESFQADPANLLAAALLADRFVAETTEDTVSRATALLKELYPD
jgi:hypothetical protein